jgi:hypothetical protein
MQSPPPPDRSRLAQLLEYRLGENLHDWIAVRRAMTPRQSWRDIAWELRETTGVDVTDNTLRNWYPDLTVAGQAEQEGQS